ncbi:hypothetical protein DRO35_05790 [Candidatus Bathyarchaeota archaeon]|nr:MAG: hypothetical protein DRO35_05790 [Candidatus Bathyarchaeota archaeon]
MGSNRVGLIKILISVILPAYNEEKYIQKCFDRVYKVLMDYGEPFEIILEEDGSTDRTPEIIDKIAARYPNVKALHFPNRMGKGFGIKKCFENAKGKYIVLIDADMEYPPEKIPHLLNALDGKDIVVGARKLWKNIKNRKVRIVRALLSRFYSALINWLFGVNLLDYQSGFKAFKREVIEKIQPLISNGFEIDSEILIKAVNKGFRIGFVPIEYTYKGNSKVNIFRDPVKMFLSMIKWKINGKF